MNEPTIDLLPCPFCDKPDTAKVSSSFDVYDDDQGNGECWAVFCDASNPNGRGGCGASGGFKPTQNEAIEAWNKRASLKSLDAQTVPVEPKFREFRGCLKPVDRGMWVNGPSNFYSASEVDAAIETLQSALKRAQEERDNEKEVRNCISRAHEAEQKRAEKAEAALKLAQEELEKANNEFGSQTAAWPDLWKRIAEIKQYSGEQWRRAEKAEALAEQCKTIAWDWGQGVTDAETAIRQLHKLFPIDRARAG